MFARAMSRTPHGLLFEVDAEGGGGGGGGGETPKTFTQEDLNKVVGQRLADERKKYADYDSHKEKAAKLADVEAELAKLREEKADAGKTAEERERLAADRAAKQLERERNEITTKLTASEQRAEASENRYRSLIVSNALGSGLDAAKVLSTARDDAIEALRSRSEIEIGDDGKILTVTYGGIAYKTPAEAATAFLKDKDFFAAGPSGGGGGTKPPTGGGGAGSDGRQPNTSTEGLLSQGFALRTQR